MKRSPIGSSKAVMQRYLLLFSMERPYFESARSIRKQHRKICKHTIDLLDQYGREIYTEMKKA